VALNLILHPRVEGDTAIVTCGGPIVYDATARRFRACVSRLLRRHRRVILDLGAVTHIDARGVGILAVLLAQARSADRQLVLARSSDRVERVLRLTRLDVELHNDSVRDRSARPAEADEDRGVLEQAVVRTHVGPYEAPNGSRGASI
jgi:anti-sigma B factor antagonist